MPPKTTTPKSQRTLRSRTVAGSSSPADTPPLIVEEEVGNPPPMDTNPMDPRGPLVPPGPEEARARGPGPDIPAIDPMILPRGLPIRVPQGLREIPIPHHLPRFSGSKDEDPSAHIEKFVEILTSSLVTDPGYYLIWFPNTLVGTAYSWYRSHAAEFFVTWGQLQEAFLRYFRPETGQQQALAALNSLRRGSTEDITTYIRRFQIVKTRYVGDLLNNDTLRHYFIQGIDSQSTIRDILSRMPKTLEDAIDAALEVEKIDKENERMIRREGESIPAFIPVHHYQIANPVTYQHLPSKNGFNGSQPLPLATRDPNPVLMLPAPQDGMEQLRSEIRQVTNDMAKSVRQLTEQMTNLIQKREKQAPIYHESGSHTTGVWCNHCGQANHTPPYCPLLKDQPQQQLRPRAPAQSPPQPYRHPNANQSRTNGNGSNGHCKTCQRNHVPGQCWVENNIVCERCGKHHPTTRCTTLDKVVPLDFPQADYAKQSQDNQRGARFMEPRKENAPPNLYYDHINNRQTHNAPEAVQTAQGVIPLNSEPRTQDVRYLDSQLDINQASLRVEIEMENDQQARTFLPALVVTRGGSKTDPPPLAIPTHQEQEESDLDSSSTSSDESPRLTDLHDTLHKAAKEVRFDPNPPVQMEFDEDEYQFVPATDAYVDPVPRPRVAPPKSTNPSVPYNLWKDLSRAKADISFGQLIQIAPSLRREMKEGATMPRIKKTSQVNKVELVPDLRNSKESFDAVEIEVEIVDKTIPRVLVDDGSSVNLMPAFTMEKLGLQVTHPSYVTLKCADQSSVKTIGRIKDLRLQTGGVDYTVTFEVIKLREEANEGYPLLLGRGFLRQCGGIVNWAGRRPTFTYGPPEARTMVAIVPRGPLLGSEGKHELPTVQTSRAEAMVDLGPIKCIGPGLYDYVDDGTFAKWLQDHPNSEDEAFVLIEEEITDPPPTTDGQSATIEEETITVPAEEISTNLTVLEDPEVEITRRLATLDLSIPSATGGDQPTTSKDTTTPKSASEDLHQANESTTVTESRVEGNEQLAEQPATPIEHQSQRFIPQVSLAPEPISVKPSIQLNPCIFCFESSRNLDCVHQQLDHQIAPLLCPSPPPDVHEQQEHMDLTILGKPLPSVSELAKDRRVIRRPHPYLKTPGTSRPSPLGLTTPTKPEEMEVLDVAQHEDPLPLAEAMDVTEEAPSPQPPLGDSMFQGEPYGITNAPEILQRRLRAASIAGDISEPPSQPESSVQPTDKVSIPFSFFSHLLQFTF